jgi:hypothetical protein
MKLPKQVPAIERKVNKEAAIPSGAKVNPSAWPADEWLQGILGQFGV